MSCDPAVMARMNHPCALNVRTKASILWNTARRILICCSCIRRTAGSAASMVSIADRTRPERARQFSLQERASSVCWWMSKPTSRRGLTKGKSRPDCAPVAPNDDALRWSARLSAMACSSSARSRSSDAVSQGAYVNLTLVNHSETEFVMDFIFVQPHEPRARVRTTPIGPTTSTRQRC